MAGTQAASLPFSVLNVIGSSDALPTMRRIAQHSSLTINRGTPVVVESGYVVAVGTIDGVDDVIAGICDQTGDNLAASGVAPQGGSGLTYGKVPNQPSAVNIPVGAPMADGLMGLWLAVDTTTFVGVTDDSHTVGVADIGTLAGMTKDTGTGYWFVDTTITSEAAGACVVITDLVDVGVVGGRVGFRFLKTYQQLSAL